MKSVKAVALLVLALFAVSSFGAPNIVGYMKIDGVQGSSKNAAHTGWLELYSFDFQSAGSNSSHFCYATNVATFLIAGEPTSGSGEAKLRQMCRARTPIALMKVDMLGSPVPHMLKNVQFTGCKENGDGYPAEFEQIRYAECSAHRRPSPVVSIGSTPRAEPAR